MLSKCVRKGDLPSGGQKSVYLAEHPEYGEVVIKTGDYTSISSMERIQREVELLKKIDSSSFPRQYHFEVEFSKKQFIIIEDFIEGTTLRAQMNRFSNPIDILQLIREIILAMSPIWKQNIIHRDLKPENIIIKPDGKPCIIDFGIARFLDYESLTKTINSMGPCTPIYAAPEQLTNNKDLIDPRTDFFCLGIVALELFLHSHPFSPELVKNQNNIPENILQNLFVCSKETIPEDVKMKILAQKTLQTQPYQRIRTAKLFIDLINELLP